MEERTSPYTCPADSFVVVATHNEAPNIVALVRGVLGLGEEFPHMVVVDDASPDGTADLAEETAANIGASGRLHVVRRPGKLGYGSAIADGIKAARAAGARYVATMDADFSHDPADLPLLFAPLHLKTENAGIKYSGNADCVVGSRYVGGIRIINWPLRRLILSVFANHYVAVILRLGITDATSGMRAYRADIFDHLDVSALQARGYAFLVELMYRLRRAGGRVDEVPIIFSERREGQSKMSKAIIIESAFRPWLLLLKRLTGGIPSGKLLGRTTVGALTNQDNANTAVQPDSAV